MTDYLALYLPTEPMSAGWIRGKPGVELCEVTLDSTGRPSQYRIRFLGRELTVNVMSQNEMPGHLAGISNFVMQMHDNEFSEHTVSTLESIAKIKTVLGCVVEPGMDDEGYVGGFFTSIVKHHQGLMFFKDSIFDSDGQPIIGPLSME